MQTVRCLLLGSLLGLSAIFGARRVEAVTVQPGNLAAALASVRSGARIVLAPGPYATVLIAHRTFSPAITIDARDATFQQITIRQSKGVTIVGGRLDADLSQTFGVLIDTSQDVSVSGMHVSGTRAGMSVNRSQDVKLENNDFDGVRSDGINLAGSQRVLVANNQCHDFHPIPQVYDARGKMVSDGDHSDCVQGWSIVGAPPTADITIEGNKAVGASMQGISFFNPGQGGYDRLIVRGNDLSLGMWNGIVLLEARDSVVRDNTVGTLPGSKAPFFPHRPIVTWVRVSGTGNTVCGNTIEEPRASDPGATRPCPQSSG